jgi:hypothetical protein
MTVPHPETPPWLPPKPDPYTGEPRPPRAHRNFHEREPTPTDRKPRKHPPSPTDRGPILEWMQDTKREMVLGGLFGTGVIAAFFTWKFGGLGWVTTWWWAWIFVVLCALGLYEAARKAWVAAGATWMQEYRNWVDTYDLTEVAIKSGGYRHVLRLSDSAGRRVSLPLSDVQRNQALWDLVYNGILHSVASGQAEASKGTRKILELPGSEHPHRHR